MLISAFGKCNLNVTIEKCPKRDRKLVIDKYQSNENDDLI